MKRVFAPLLAIGVAGCASGGMTARYDGPELKGAPSVSHQVDDRDLLVKIPEWAGPVKSARQISGALGVKQEIVIPGGTLGDNVIEVAIAMGVPGNGSELTISHAPSAEDIDEELRTKFPGVSMRAVPKSELGSETRYDLAVGRAADGTRCVYAWYWTENYRIASDPSGIATVETMLSQKKEPASLRIRLCSKYVKLDDYASLVRQIHFVSAAETERIVVGSAATTEDAALSALHPPETKLEDAVVGSSGSETGASKAPYRSAKTVSRKRVARAAEPISQPIATVQQPGMAAGNGLRYLAPPPLGAQSATHPTEAAIRSAVALSPPQHGQMLNLPAAAMRGPVNGSSAPSNPASGAY
jgi:hypothetical protein